MSIKPILFNQEMVRAILDGRKTVTRRLVKKPYFVDERGGCVTTLRTAGKGTYAYRKIGEMPYPENIYEIGDILYVRETFAVGKIDSGEESDGSERIYISQCVGENDIIPKEYATRNNIGVDDVIWKPSLFMPKEAARIFLKVTDVKVERLQDMKIEDISKEGFSRGHGIDETWYERGRKDFSKLWDSTVKEDWQKFASSPYVWVVEFERCEKPKGWC